MRHSGLLGALIATALLLCMLPGVLRGFHPEDSNRMSETLRPAKSRTLTVWLTGAPLGDEALLSQLLTAYETAQPGLRIYLRRADSSELLAKAAVLPDVALYGIGDISMPDKCFQPISPPESLPSETLSCGRSAGTQYGLPLWYAPTVLSLPQSWLLSEEETVPPASGSLFGKGTPPQRQEPDLSEPASLPWARMLETEQLSIQPGIAHQQLMHSCPLPFRQQLCSVSLTAAKKQIALVCAYPQHLTKTGSEARCAVLLAPAVSDRVRIFSLCRPSSDAAGLLQFLTGGEVFSRLEERGWLSVCRRTSAEDPLLRQALERSDPGLYFPNAYAHTRQELYSLCEDAFHRQADPVATLLQLR